MMAHRTRKTDEQSRRPLAHPLPGLLSAGLVALAVLLAPGLQGCTDAHSEARHVHAHQELPRQPDRPAIVLGPEDADHFWVFAERKDSLGSGGEFHVYIDPERHPEAAASFARFGLGVGGALPEHRHEKTEEIAYFLSGEGMIKVYEDGQPRSIPVRSGHVWYTPPGAWHAVTNTGDEPLILVFAAIPNEKKGLLSFFKKIGARPGAEAAQLAPEEFSRLAAEHDLLLKPPTVIE